MRTIDFAPPDRLSIELNLSSRCTRARLTFRQATIKFSAPPQTRRNTAAYCTADLTGGTSRHRAGFTFRPLAPPNSIAGDVNSLRVQ